MSSFVTAGTQVSESDLLAQNAQDTANVNATSIKNINDPNYLSPFEKPHLKVQMDNFATIYAADKDIATSEGIDFTAYDAAYQAYLAYMTPLIADMTTYSPIVRSTFNSMVTAVQVEQKRFNTATQEQYNQQIKKAQTDIDDGQTKYKALQSEAETMKSSVAGVADAADRAISSAGFASNTASAASQAASSAVASAISAQSDASYAVAQASSAAADSKDAKQIAGAVSQSYKTLTDGSTMTIAELESGLAVKLTKSDLDGYATETWAQNQINATADGINATLSSIKSTVDGQTTDINDLKADSKSFKTQFTTVNGTLNTQSIDIGTLQASSKELTSGFNTLTSDNTTNKNDISQLKQTATEVSSTLETVQTQVQNSAVGTNLLTGTGNHTLTNTGRWAADYISNENTDNLLPLFKGLEGQIVTVSVDYEYSGFIAGDGYNRLGWEIGIHGDSTLWKGPWCFPNNDSGSGRMSSTFVVPKNITSVNEGVGYIQFSGSGAATLSHLKVEKGSLATDWCANPADNATVTALTQVKQTADGAEALATNNQGDIAKLQVTAKGLQSTVSDKVSSDQLTQLSGQLTNQIKGLSSSTSSQFTQTANDINAMVKKGDVVNQFNIDAGGALLQTAGGNTKIVLSAPNIIFDTANPVQIPNANIPGVLTNKTFEAGTITATTKITGSDIEAPLIHSPNGSFKLDGNTGDIIGASIHSADNSWGIDKDGNINGVDIKIGGTYSHVSTGSGQVITGAIYNELDSAGYHQWTDDNDHVRINNGVITITNNADEKANANVEGIPLGVFISEGNAQFTGSLKIGNIYTNGAHTINSIDGGGIYFEGGTDTGNSMVDIYTGNIHATGTIQTGNIMIGNSHSITMQDGAKSGTMYFSDSSGNQSYALKAKSFSQSSLLSLKTDITEIDPHEALVELVKNDFMSYHYKNDKSNDPKTVSVILDDINPIPKYYTSDIFKSADGTGRNDGNVVGYLGLSVKDLNSREIADKAKIAELETRLQKLEGAN